MTDHDHPVDIPANESAGDIACVCGESFAVPVDLADGEHLHCPKCGSFYDHELRFQINKRQVATLQAHRKEWSK